MAMTKRDFIIVATAIIDAHTLSTQFKEDSGAFMALNEVSCKLANKFKRTYPNFDKDKWFTYISNKVI